MLDRWTRPLAFVPALLLVLGLGLAACGGGSGGGGGGPIVIGFLTNPEVESNDTPGTANVLIVGQAGVGDLTTIGDQDYWSFTMLSAGFVRFEIFGARFDQATWAAVPNSPMLTLFDTDGVTVLGQHDFDGDVLSGPTANAGGRFDRDFDCHYLPAAGTYYVRVAQDTPAAAGGTYALAISSVSPGALQMESEAVGATGGNDTGGTADAITPGAVRGHISTGDADVFAFTVTAPPVIAVFDFKAWQLGGQGAAPNYPVLRVDLLDTDGTTVLEGGASSTSGYGFDPLLSYGIVAAGTYYVRVQPTGGAGAGFYQMHHEIRQVGLLTETEANDIPGTANPLAEGQFVSGTTSNSDPDVFSFVGTVGEMRAIRHWDFLTLQDTSTQSVIVQVLAPDGTTVIPQTPASVQPLTLNENRFTLQQSGTHYVRVVGTAGAAQPYILRNVRIKQSSFEAEPNGSLAQANNLDANGRASGLMDAANDEDWFRFTAEADELVRLDLFGSMSGSGLDFRRNGYGSAIGGIVTIFDSGGTQIAQSMPSAGAGVHASGMSGRLGSVVCAFVAPSAGTYYVRVEDAAAASGVGRGYLLERR